MLQKKGQLELEQQILAKTDLLIETAIETSMLVGEEQKGKLEESVEIVAEIAILLKDYLGGHPEHFETLIWELTKQKLPDENVLKSFGDFNTHLDTAIKKGLELYQNTYSETSEISETLEVVGDEDGERKENEKDVETDDAVLEGYTEGEQEIGSELINSFEQENQESTYSHLANREDDAPVDVPVSADSTEHASEKLQIDNDTDKDTYAEDDSFEEKNPSLEQSISDQTIHMEQRPASVAQENKSGQDSWNLALKHVFPDASIIKGYSYKGMTFSYYLPEHTIAIDTKTPDKKEAVWKEYLCKQQSIKLLSIQATENARPRQLVRAIRRALAQNQCRTS